MYDKLLLFSKDFLNGCTDILAIVLTLAIIVGLFAMVFCVFIGISLCVFEWFNDIAERKKHDREFYLQLDEFRFYLESNGINLYKLHDIMRILQDDNRHFRKK